MEVYLDYCILKCPCGNSISGEGEPIVSFRTEHLKHTNRFCEEYRMPECYKIFSSDTPNFVKYKIK